MKKTLETLIAGAWHRIKHFWLCCWHYQKFQGANYFRAKVS
jgi:hypothetical protein